MIYCLLLFVGRPDPGYAPSQFIPFDPFLSGGMYCSAAAHSLSVVFLRNIICGESRRAGRYRYLPGKRGGVSLEAVSSPSECSRPNLLIRQVFYSEEIKEYLTRKFLPALGIDGWRRLLARVWPERR